MKRPQYSIRLLLLIVALTAVTVSWLAVLARARQNALYWRVLPKQKEITLWEGREAEWNEKMLGNTDAVARKEFAVNADYCRKQISHLKRTIEEMEN